MSLVKALRCSNYRQKTRTKADFVILNGRTMWSGRDTFVCILASKWKEDIFPEGITTPVFL
jgi:hypothetical protein